MKILHIAPNAPYNNYWGYQDNLLPKYQKKLGHDVAIIVTNTMHKDGKIVETECSDYTLDDGVRVIRLKKKRYFHRAITGLMSRLEVFSYLKEIRPDFVFFHGLLSSTIYDVIKYKKEVNPECVVVQDNHLDYNIGYKFQSIKQKLFRYYYRFLNKKSAKYVDRIYGVTPWRKKYAEDYFKIPPEKTDVLIMGADDDQVRFSERDSIRTKIRDEYKISDDDFLLVTGGKIDNKKKIHLLMQACSNLENVKLLVFGSVNDDIRQEFDKILFENENIIYVGWIESDKVYDYFFAADLIVFPGQHSVLWEQACAAKVPCVFEKWEGMEHVNNGGNSEFISAPSAESIREKIIELRYTSKYYRMQKVAQSSATDIYMYSEIAKKSLECVQNKK